MPVEIDIEHVARLARLGLKDQETERLRTQLGAILEHAAKVGEIPTADLPANSPGPGALLSVSGSIRGSLLREPSAQTKDRRARVARRAHPRENGSTRGGDRWSTA
jgi:aspartyl/glutamyl-tRNA(Asn/Gln) amidotransferase C subunit